MARRERALMAGLAEHRLRRDGARHEEVAEPVAAGDISPCSATGAWERQEPGRKAMRMLITTAMALALASAANAQSNTNLDRAKGTVDNIRQADPPRVSTGTVVTPTPPVQPRPSTGTDVQRMRTNPPPSPPTGKK
jgi:hypothetical protein